VFALVAGLFGLTIGSFLNVVIYRLPVMLDRHWRQECIAAGYAEKEQASNEKSPTFNLVFPGSRCPHCNAPIKAWQNIPVISYLLLKGACHNCGHKISVRYPIVELLSGILSAITAYRLGPSVALLSSLFLLWALIALSYIDFDHQILPDVIVLPFLWAGLLLNTQHVFTDLQSWVPVAVAGLPGIQTGDRQGRHGIRRFQTVCAVWCLAGMATAAVNYPAVVRRRRGSWPGYDPVQGARQAVTHAVRPLPVYCRLDCPALGT